MTSCAMEISIGDQVLVLGRRRAIVVAKCLSYPSFAIRFLGKNGKPYGLIMWHNVSHLTPDC